MEAKKQNQPKTLTGKITVSQAMEEFTMDLRMKRRTVRTIEYYGEAFTVFNSVPQPLHIRDVTEADIRKVLLTKINAPYVYFGTYRALKAFFRWLLRRHVIDSNPIEFIDKPRMDDRIIPTVPAKEFRLLLNTCDDTYMGIRDRAIIMVLYDCGLRRSELTSMLISNINMGKAIVRFQGKGGKWRIVHFGENTRDALWAWLGQHTRKHDELWLTDWRKPIGYTGIAQMLERRCRQAGIPVYSPHKWRHTNAIEMLTDGMPIVAVQHHLGHTRVSTTEIYLRNIKPQYWIDEHTKHSPGDKE
jgi:site-specific recombinase XerD